MAVTVGFVTEPGEAVEQAHPAGGDAPEDDRSWLTPGVLGVGAASLFSDTGHELVTSILPTFPHLEAAFRPRRPRCDRRGLRRADRVVQTRGWAVGQRSPAPGPARVGRLPRHGGGHCRDRPGHRGVAGGNPARDRLDVARYPLTGSAHVVDVAGQPRRVRPGIRHRAGRRQCRRDHRAAGRIRAGSRSRCAARDRAGDRAGRAGRGRDHARGPGSPAHRRGRRGPPHLGAEPG